MKITIDRNDFLKELTLINGIVEKKSTIAILSNMYIKAENDRLYLKGTDLEVGLTVSIKADIEEEGIVIVPAKVMFDIVKVLPEGELTMWIDNTSLKIEKDGRFYSVNAQVDDNYPVIPDYDFDEKSVILPKSQLVDVISTISISINNEIIKDKSLNGVFFDFENETLNFAASNRHTLFVASYSGMEPFFEEKENFVVSKKTFLELKKMIQLSSLDDELLLGRDGSNIFFKIGPRVLFSRLLANNFINYKTFLNPSSDAVEIVIKVKHMKDALKELMPLYGQYSDKVVFEFEKGFFTASLQDVEGSVAIVKKEVEYQGESFKTGYNINHLNQFFSVVDVEEVKALMDKNSESFTFFQFHKNGVDYTFLINPMIIN
ncbi:DNA polymerase III subunit beta [Thermotomaculum hydrothermale]|uniref:Beta sliding clamp n=1 Tax=Thermotomaculum hydrothermale TaxID=981385 RepID=A0A7R6SZ53_9BACT|nr:DNA polymerase III subunit beta [Thermotomaculum hydrothermale]BBB33494.1 DNA polymerase III subunit beta [Thermotomaculum hydrothermale]